MFHQRSWSRYHPAHPNPASLWRSRQDRLSLVDARPPRRRPPVGHGGGPGATRPNVPRRAPGPAASPQALRAGQTPCVYKACSVSQALPHSFSPSGWIGECISRPRLRLRRSWRTRLRPPLQHTVLTAHPCGQRLRHVSVPPDFSGPVPSVHSFVTLPILLAVQRVACLQFRLARTRPG